MDALLLLAQLSADEERTFSAVAAASRLELVKAGRVEAAVAWLESHDARVVVFQAELVGSERLCTKVRAKKSLAGTPLIALVRDASDTFIEKLYTLGVDDVISEDLGPGFVTRLRALPDRVAVPPARGMAVIADADRERCNVVGRVLANAGYDVKWAHDHVSLAFYTQTRKPRVVVANASLAPPRSLIADARRKGLTAPWVVLASRKELVKYAEALAGLQRVSVVAATAAPETVLYASNELVRGELPPSRTEERQLYGTAVWFRAAGEETDELGFAYNVSPGGLFVRTLAPVEQDEVWIELRPPRCRQRVRLEGRVAWRRPYVPTSAALGPPGFGISVTGGLTASLSLWREHARALLESPRTHLAAVDKLSAGRRDDARTSGEYMLLEVPSESRLAVVRVVGDASTIPPPAPVIAVTASEMEPELEAELERESALEREPEPESTPPADAEDDAIVPASDDIASEPELVTSEPAIEVRSSELLPVSDEPVHDDTDDDDVDEVAEDPAPTLQPLRPSDRTPPPRARPPRGMDGQVVGFLVLGLAAGAAAALTYFNWQDENHARVTAARPPTETAAPSPPPLPSATAEPAPSATAEPAPSATAEPAPSATAEPAPSATAEPSAAASPAASDLGPLDGYLVVRFAGGGDVYSTGFKIGPANDVNRSRCGLRWIRVGSGDPPRWISHGATVDVKCQTTTTVTLEAEKQ